MADTTPRRSLFDFKPPASSPASSPSTALVQSASSSSGFFSNEGYELFQFPRTASPTKTTAATTSTPPLDLASPTPKKTKLFQFTSPKDTTFSNLNFSFASLRMSDSPANSGASSPATGHDSDVETPASTVPSEADCPEEMERHLASMFLSVKTQQGDEIKTSPLLTLSPLEVAPPSHYGLLGVDSRAITSIRANPATCDDEGAPLSTSPAASLSASRIFHNVAAPSSTFICGSQGSGKSNSLACLLENCLLPNRDGVLPSPLTGLVFHYDGFNSDAGGLPCEAACLASDRRIRVRVVCAPTNIKTIRETYRKIPGVIIEPLQLRDSHLNTSRMLDLMAVGETNVPLYMRVVGRILREMRLEQQANGGSFNYARFKEKMLREDLTDMQRAPLNQRLDTLESFMVKNPRSNRNNKFAPVTGGNDWTPKVCSSTSSFCQTPMLNPIRPVN
jgi:hypothetical protein